MNIKIGDIVIISISTFITLVILFHIWFHFTFLFLFG